MSPKELNELGLRGHTLECEEDAFVIVLLGDSFVEALACAYDWMPESRLAHHLGDLGRSVHVVSIGTGGYGQDQQLLMLQEYFKTNRADLVLLWETPDNDVWNNLFPTHWPANGPPKPTFWLEGETLHGPSEPFGTRVTPEWKLVALARKLLTPTRDEIWEKRLPQSYTPIPKPEGPVDDSWQARWDENSGMMQWENLETEKSHFAVHLTPRSPRFALGVRLTHRLLREIESTARAHDAQFLAFRHITPAEREPAFEIVHHLNGKYFRTSSEQFLQNIAEMNEGIPFLEVPITLSEWRVGPEDGHLNEHAVDEAMRTLARAIADRIPETVPAAAP